VKRIPRTPKRRAAPPSVTTAGSSTASARTWLCLKGSRWQRCISATGPIMKRWWERNSEKT